MVAWEVFHVSLLKVTSWAGIIQQIIPYPIHKHIWNICALRHLKVSISEWGDMARGGNDRDGSKIWSPALPISPAITKVVKGQCPSPTGKTRGAEAAIQLSGLHCGWAQVQGQKNKRRIVAADQPPSPGKQSHRCRNPCSPPFHGPPGITTLTGQTARGQKQHSSLSGPYSLQLNPLESTEPQMH